LESIDPFPFRRFRYPAHGGRPTCGSPNGKNTNLVLNEKKNITIKSTQTNNKNNKRDNVPES
jgi:hypothetical protein